MRKKRITRWLLYALLVVLAFIYLIPVYVLIATSIKGVDEITLDKMWALPTQIDFSGYKLALHYSAFIHYGVCLVGIWQVRLLFCYKRMILAVRA